MNDYAGGRNALGFQENAAESGRAVEMRATQAGVSKLPMFENLKIWKKKLFETVAWWAVNYMSPAQVLRIIGADGDIKYIEMDKYLYDTLQEMKYDLIIEEVAKSDSVRERNLQQLQMLFQTMPGIPPEAMMKMLLPYTAIPESKKAELTETVNQLMQYNQQQAEQQKQSQLERQAMDQLEKRKLKETLLSQNPDLQTTMDIKQVLNSAAQTEMAGAEMDDEPQISPEQQAILKKM
jgi:hypothetical protein